MTLKGRCAVYEFDDVTQGRGGVVYGVGSDSRAWMCCVWGRGGFRRVDVL